MAAASNEWIALLDADDVWDPRKLELQWELRQSNADIDIIFTDYDQIDPAGSVLVEDTVLSLRQYRRVAEVRLSENASLLTSDVLAASLPGWNFLLPSSALFSRGLVQRAGGFDPDVEAEDFDFFLRCIATGNAAMIERPLVGYVRHPSSLSATWAPDTVILRLSEHVIENSAAYHQKTIPAFRDQLPTLLLRDARVCASRRQYRRAVQQVSRAVASVWAPRVAARMCLRVAARSNATRSLLNVFPGGRDFVGMIPGVIAGKSVPRSGRSLAHWASIITDAEC
jgi:hypothetical protein